MKNVMAILFFAVLSFSSMANEKEFFKLEEGSKFLRSIEGKVENVQHLIPRCPPNARCYPTTFLKINFILSGCLDSLGPVVYTLRSIQDSTSEKYELIVHAQEVNNEQSIVAFCAAAPMASKTLTLKGRFTRENLKVTFLK